MKRSILAAALALAAGPAFAAPTNHTVVITVPVDIAAMPYIKAFTVGCRLTYPTGTVITPDMGGASYNRFDSPVTGGQFHGKATITITAADGPAPTGYHCDLSVAPSDGSTGFAPVPSTQTGAPAQHQAAPGTTPVTAVDGTFVQPQIRREIPRK